MTDQINELIKQIAVTNGIAVSRDDPIMILQTVIHKLIQDNEKSQQVILAQYKEEQEALAMKWGKEAKEISDRILNAALKAGKDTMLEMIQGGAAPTSADDVSRKDLNSVIKKVHINISEIRTIAIINIFASCFTLIAATLILWTTMR